MNKILLALTIVVLTISSACAQNPDNDRIKADLLGRNILMSWRTDIDTGFYKWRFRTLADFNDFKIVKVNKTASVLEYLIATKLSDNGRIMFDTKITAVYRKDDGKWKIISVEPLSMVPVQ